MDIGVVSGLEHASILQAAGCSFVEVNVQGFFKPQQDPAAWAAGLEAAREAVIPPATSCCFLPGSLRSTGPEVDRAAIAAYAETAFARAHEAGCAIMVFGSGGSRQLPAGCDYAAATAQFTEVLRDLGPIAQRHGVTVVLEPLNSGECNFVTSVPEGAAIVRAVDHPNIRLLADFYHMLRDGQGPEEMIEHLDLIAHVHVAECAQRTPPGVAGDDFRPYLRTVLEGGYRGRISLECKWDDLPAQVGPAVAELRSQIESVTAAGSR
jgi:sugar phosphate isomerase/epimerase